MYVNIYSYLHVYMYTNDVRVYGYIIVYTRV